MGNSIAEPLHRRRVGDHLWRCGGDPDGLRSGRAGQGRVTGEGRATWHAWEREDERAQSKVEALDGRALGNRSNMLLSVRGHSTGHPFDARSRIWSDLILVQSLLPGPFDKGQGKDGTAQISRRPDEAFFPSTSGGLRPFSFARSWRTCSTRTRECLMAQVRQQSASVLTEDIQDTEGAQDLHRRC